MRPGNGVEQTSEMALSLPLLCPPLWWKVCPGNDVEQTSGMALSLPLLRPRLWWCLANGVEAVSEVRDGPYPFTAMVQILEQTSQIAQPPGSMESMRCRRKPIFFTQAPPDGT